MKKFKLFSILIIPLTFVLYFVNSVPAASINKVCAQANYGEQCVNNYSTCPTGSQNLLKLMSEGGMSFGNDLTQDSLTTSFNATYGTNARNICLNITSKSFIVRWMTSSEQVAGENITKVKSESRDAIPRICPARWTIQQAPNRVNFLAGYYSACCPTGFKAINTNNQSSESSYGSIVCCKVDPSKPAPTSWDATPGDAGGCKGSDGNIIPGENNNSGQAHGGPFTSVQAAADFQAQNAGIIVGIQQSGGSFDPFVDTSGGFNGGFVKPQFGFGLGLSYPGQIVTQQASAGGSDKVCPANTVCAVAAAADVTAGKIVDANSYKTTPGLVCSLCFVDGVPMGSVPDATDKSKTYLRYCDKTKANLYRDELQIGTPDITNGAIISDPANRPAYIACFNSGGVYTAIGCVDPTPTGIITGIIRIALGVMGGVALLQLIYVGILYQAGQEDKIKQARSQLIATLTGIAVLVFSVLILRIIGVNVLDILPVGSV